LRDAPPHIDGMKPIHLFVFAVLFILGALAFRDLTEPVAHNLYFEVNGDDASVYGTTDSNSHNLVKDFVRIDKDPGCAS